MALLKKAASVLVSEWGANSVPPSYVTVEDHHFSLANMFQMLASTLSSIGQTGKAPNVVPLLHVYGPDEIVDEAGPNQGQVSVNVVISAGASLANRLQDQHWTAGPNMIPAWTEVAGYIDASFTAEVTPMRAKTLLAICAMALASATLTLASDWDRFSACLPIKSGGDQS